MRYFFDNPERQAALREACRSWRGTPFVQGAQVRGEGVDCLRFVAAVLAESSVPVDELGELPRYSIYEGRHTEHTRLLAWLHGSESSRSHLHMIDKDDPVMCGDLLAVIQPGGLGPHHLAIALNKGVAYHCSMTSGVCQSYLPGFRVAGIWRVLDNFGEVA